MTITSQTYQERLKILTEEVSIYPVSCEKLACGRRDQDWLDAVIAGGARIVQLRDKIADDRTLLAKAHYFRQKTREAGVLFLVNNRVDIALLAGADGVHLGNSDLPASEVRKLAPDFIIGVSANTDQQAATAQERGASYYNIGPIYPTDTKGGLTSFIGPDAITSFSARSPLPFTVMGGIKLDNVRELTSRGARRIAVVTALTRARDIQAETRLWHKTIAGEIA